MYPNVISDELWYRENYTWNRSQMIAICEAAFKGMGKERFISFKGVESWVTEDACSRGFSFHKWWGTRAVSDAGKVSDVDNSAYESACERSLRYSKGLYRSGMVGNGTKTRVIGDDRMTRVNQNGKTLIDSSKERGLIIWNTWLINSNFC